jgi:hypothetical protein
MPGALISSREVALCLTIARWFFPQAAICSRRCRHAVAAHSSSAADPTRRIYCTAGPFNFTQSP